MTEYRYVIQAVVFAEVLWFQQTHILHEQFISSSLERICFQSCAKQQVSPNPTERRLECLSLEYFDDPWYFNFWPQSSDN